MRFKFWRKAADLIMREPIGSTTLALNGGWVPLVREPFSGAWQRSMAAPFQDTITHSTFFACITQITGDISKCRMRLMNVRSDNVSIEVDVPAFSPVLRKPNSYQTRIEFLASWMLSKLTRGNTYVLKERDNRGIVTALHVLDPTRVQVLVSPGGSVFYSLGQDMLAGLSEGGFTVPAREIIHDRMNTIYHPLIGLSPIAACGHNAAQSLTILHQMTRFIRKGSQVSGILTVPTPISEETARALEAAWQQGEGGETGGVPVLGGGMSFQKIDKLTAVDNQLIEQQRWNDEKICAVNHMPPYIVSVGPMPSYNNVEALWQQYYTQCLQIHFESIETCLTEGLGLPQEPNGTWYEVVFEIDSLSRMDSAQRMDIATKGVVGGILTPNEARARFNLTPVTGGDTPYLQVQNYSLAALDRRDTTTPPPTTPAPETVPDPERVPTKDLTAQFVAAVQQKALAAGLYPVPVWGDFGTAAQSD